METMTLFKWTERWGFLRSDFRAPHVYAHLDDFRSSGATPCLGADYSVDLAPDARRPGQRRAATIREA